MTAKLVYGLLGRVVFLSSHVENLAMIMTTKSTYDSDATVNISYYSNYRATRVLSVLTALTIFILVFLNS